jgi:hypothetical protein
MPEQLHWGGLKRGFGNSVGVSDAGRHPVFVPADALVVDYVFEVVFVVIEAG